MHTHDTYTIARWYSHAQDKYIGWKLRRVDAHEVSLDRGDYPRCYHVPRGLELDDELTLHTKHGRLDHVAVFEPVDDDNYYIVVGYNGGLDYYFAAEYAADTGRVAEEHSLFVQADHGVEFVLGLNPHKWYSDAYIARALLEALHARF